ncbi:uncharacterized protein METZ01_LOCUS281437, partial [marine metagenome]
EKAVPEPVGADSSERGRHLRGVGEDGRPDRHGL